MQTITYECFVSGFVFIIGGLIAGLVKSPCVTSITIVITFTIGTYFSYFELNDDVILLMKI